MSDILSIASAQKCSNKQRIKEILGFLMATVSPIRKRSLLSNPKGNPRGPVDKAIMSFLKRKAVVEGDAKFLEKMNQDFWEGRGGEVFSKNCIHRFRDLFLTRQNEDVQAIKQVWERSRATRIVEFGCGSGLVLNHLTRSFRGVESAVGIDINSRQIAKNKVNHRFDPRIEFESADAAEWLFQNGKPASLFVSNGGVLEYFRRERLEKMLNHIATNLRPAIFFAIEPVAADHELSTTFDSVPFGDELSFSHNYQHLFQKNGFQVIHNRETVYKSWRMVATIAVTHCQRLSS